MSTKFQMSLPPHTLSSESPRIRGVLEQAQQQVGFIPNMYARMVNSPGLLETYLTGYDRFRKESGFTPAEQEVVFLTISRENGCHYCVAAHSVLADKFSNVQPAVTDAIRDGAAIPEPKLRALSEFTRTLMAKAGRPDRADVDALFHGSLHPYTQALLHSIPVLGQSKLGRLDPIKGMVPDQYNRPTGCAFHPRCAQRIPGKCDQLPIPLIELKDGRAVRCVLYERRA